jgi:hypothetical protein
VHSPIKQDRRELELSIAGKLASLPLFFFAWHAMRYSAIRTYMSRRSYQVVVVGLGGLRTGDADVAGLYRYQPSAMHSLLPMFAVVDIGMVLSLGTSEVSSSKSWPYVERWSSTAGWVNVSCCEAKVGWG